MQCTWMLWWGNWSWGSTLNLELNLDTAPVQKYLPWSVLELMVSDLEGSGYSFYSVSFFLVYCKTLI